MTGLRETGDEQPDRGKRQSRACAYVCMRVCRSRQVFLLLLKFKL